MSTGEDDDDDEDLGELRYLFVWVNGAGELLREVVTEDTEDVLPLDLTNGHDEVLCIVSAIDQMDAESWDPAVSNAFVLEPGPEGWEFWIEVGGGQTRSVCIGMLDGATVGPISLPPYVPTPLQVEPENTVRLPIWGWDAETQEYKRGNELRSGEGYWVYALQEAIVRLRGE